MKLIDMKGVAEMLCLTVGTVRHFVLDPSFPKPYRLPNGRGGSSHPKWDAEEIEKWVTGYKECVPN